MPRGTIWRAFTALTLILTLLGGALTIATPGARAAAIVVTSLADPTGAAGTCTLRDAITAANTDTATGGCAAGSGADTITFGVTGTIPLASELAITQDLTIQGPTTSGVTISGNNATRVFRITGGAVVLANLTIADGYATDNAGTGIASVAGGIMLNSGTLILRDSTLVNNRATLPGDSRGGALVNVSGTARIINTTFSGNSAATIGGAIYSQYITDVTNSTFVGNGAGSGGAIWNNATMTLRDTIVAASTSGGNCGSRPADGGNNLDSGTSCGLSTANGSLSNTDPRLGPLANNGGPTQTYALQAGSPAIDAGDNTACPATDQRGIPRPQGLRCDIGAFEVSPPNPAPTITGLATTPSPVVAGAGGTVALTVSGANFVSGFSTIAVDGTPVATTFVDSARLTATLPAFPRTGAGAYTVTVTTSVPGGGTSNPLTLTVTNPTPGLTGLAPVLAGSSTPGVLAGSGDTALTLTGSGFAPGATVQFGGTTLTPAPANIGATSIGVTVPATLLTTARVVAITVTNPGPGGGTSGGVNFTVANAAPTLTDSSPTTATAGDGDTALTVTGTGFVAGATIAVGGQTLATTVASATSASATVPAALLRAAGNLAITVTVPGPGGGTAGGRTLVVNPADAAQLAVSAGSPQSAAVTVAFVTNLAVAVRDQYGNPVADGTTVTFAAPASGASGTFKGGGTSATATTVGGVATAPAFTANGAAGAYTVLASAGGGAVPFALTNTPGPVARFDVTAPATSAAGAPVGLAITARDAGGNLIPDYVGTVHLTSSDSQAVLPADYTFLVGDGGTKAFAATLKTAGAQTITATDTAKAGATGSAPVAVAPAAPASLTAISCICTGLPPQPIGGTFDPLAALVRDAYGNPVPGVVITFVAPVSGASLTFPGGGATVTAATDASGFATTPAPVANSTAGAYSVVASGPGGSASFALTNTPGPATRLVATTTAPGAVRAGDPVALTVTALDAGGNVATGYTGTVRFTSGDAAATLPADYTFVAGDAGAHTFSVTLRTGGAQAVTATDTANAALTATASVSVAAPATATVTASASGQGTVTPSGATRYTVGSVVRYAATPAAGQVFVGWTLDGQNVGYASPLDFTVRGDRTLVATFVARPTFTDVPTSDPDYRAITTLAALGIVNPGGVNGGGQFQPGRAVARAEVAAFLARAFGWEREFHGNPFPDKCDPTGQNCVDDALWNDVAALRDYGVVGGYTDSATCAALGTTAPCYLPRESVLKVQVVSIVARAFTKAPDLRPTGAWDRLAAVASQYTNVPDSGTQRSDLATYRQNAGPVPGQASDAAFPQPTDAATRRFVIEVLWQAMQATLGTDRVP